MEASSSSSDIKGNESTNNRPEGGRFLNAPAFRISLPKHYRQIRSEKAWENSERNAITLLHNDQLRLVMIALHESGEIPKHKVEGPCIIQVQEGRIWVETDDMSITIDEGEVLALDAGVAHCIHAEMESVILLTLTGNKGGDY